MTATEQPIVGEQHPSWPTLHKLSSPEVIEFENPRKRIHDGSDVDFFLTSTAFTRIIHFIQQLNLSMRPVGLDSPPVDNVANTSSSDTPTELPSTIQKVKDLIEKLAAIVSEVPPDPGPRRFGNVSFRKWTEVVQERVPSLVEPLVAPPSVAVEDDRAPPVTASQELTAYLLGSLGDAQRLDYGTGHELSYLAFLAGIWMLHGFDDAGDARDMSRAIVIGAIIPYLQLVRKLITTYTLEPAGSHGVWGLDDHSFIPYILGSAQYCPALDRANPMPVDVGSGSGAPLPSDIASKAAVDRLRGTNMYFDAIAFIYDVKTGPFWEHSPILYDISGVKDGWAKINKGMMKMYVAEVLSKFPVVQHFPFGSLFPWTRDMRVPPPAPSPHTSSLQSTSGSVGQLPAQLNSPGPGTRAPWASAGLPTRRLVDVPVAQRNHLEQSQGIDSAPRSGH